LAYPPAGGHRRLAPAEAAAEFVARLGETVAAWRLSDVPVGALLSGGVDSAALAALLTELSGPIHTFTIGFETAAHDEAAAARETARHLGSRHHTLAFTAADFDRLPEVVRHLEEPQCSATSLPIYLLYRACRAAGFKVILTGEGADELLGGYHWFAGDRRARPLLNLPRPVRAALAGSPLLMSAAARRVLARGAADPIQRYGLWQQVAEPAQVRRLLAFQPAGADYADPLHEPAGSLAGRHPLDQFLWLEAQTRLVDFINFEVDRMSMANSVEARPPFLDHELWEFCARLPPELKLGPRGDKRLLRAGLRGRLPASVLRRPKRGLAAPHAVWFRSGRLPAWAESALHPAALAGAGYFVPPEVQRLRAEHQSGRADHSRLLMGVLTAQLWHDQFAV
jgi:asparagine synthase (glutamine-hydrolysing)